MKIGVATIYKVNNYGAMLQAYSLCKYLQSIGHEVVLFKISLPSSKTDLKSKLKSALSLTLYKKFIKNYLPAEVDINTPVDLYLSGSDQIWNPNIVGESLYNFMFDFADDSKPICSYASSFGTAKWEHPELRGNVLAHLKRFNVLTTREKHGTLILRDTFGLVGKVVLDPCFLNDTFEEFVGSHYVESNDLVLFQLQPFLKDYSGEAAFCSKKLNTRLNNISVSRRFSKLNKSLLGWNLKRLDVPLWIKSIAEAKYVITDSFHGMVFCIIFNRQFVVVNLGNGRISRMQSLLNKLGLEERIIDTIDKAPDILLKKIDYAVVNTILKNMRDYSKNILNEILLYSNLLYS